MDFKRSRLSVLKNAKVWTKALTKFKDSTTMSRNIPDIVIPLHELSKMPTQKIIIGRFHALAASEKSKTKRYKIISKELCDLWSKMKLPKIQTKSVNRKVEKLIQIYDKNLKKKRGYNFENIFNISNENTDIIQSELSSLKDAMSDENSVSEYECENQYSSDDCDYKPPERMKLNKSLINPSVALVTNAKVSTKKAAKICKELAESGIQIATPSQPGVYKAVIKSAERKEKMLKETLKNENWCLHFDGKKIGNKELQVMFLKNEYTEIKLAVLVLENGKALTIFNGIKKTLHKFDLWQSIKMVISDTTSVNTGHKNGVVKLLKDYYKSIDLPPPQYVGCQHHILDLILRHVMDELLDGKTSSPNISYNFVPELINNYVDLKANYIQNNEYLKIKNIKWRDDMQYLYELGSAFKYYQRKKKFPYIKFKAIPPLSNARWNSRAILAILAFVLIPKYRDQLTPICEFICGPWYNIWFSNHCFNKDNFAALDQSLARFKNGQACLKRHWVREASIIPKQQRSNICAERGIKVIQDIYPLCKTTRTLNLKFMSFNN